MVTNCSADIRRGCEVQLPAVERDDLTQSREKLREVGAYLAVLARQQDLGAHLPLYRGRRSRGTSASFGDFKSFSETIGWATFQVMLSPGSFHKMPCSSAGS